MIPAGLEPGISALKGPCPDHLDEGTMKNVVFSGNRRARTFDLPVNSRTLCQLSYEPISIRKSNSISFEQRIRVQLIDSGLVYASI